MNAEYWIKHLKLVPHPEGGFYKETYQSEVVISESNLKNSHQGPRKSASLIYYLLKENECSNFHRLKSDELWIYNDGAALKIYIISPEGNLSTETLGKRIEQGEEMQVFVPSNCWFAAELCNNDSYALLSCMVTPGFVFDDFDLAKQNKLKKEFPEYTNLISRLTKE